MTEQEFKQQYVHALSFESHRAPEGLGLGLVNDQDNWSLVQDCWRKVSAALKTHFVRKGVALDHFFAAYQLRVGARLPEMSDAKAVLLRVSKLTPDGCRIDVSFSNGVGDYIKDDDVKKKWESVQVSFDELDTTLKALAAELKPAIDADIFIDCAGRVPSDFLPSSTADTAASMG